MKKPNIFDLLADAPQRIIDENAFTVAQIAKAQGVSEMTALRTCKVMIDAGKWERVWKHGATKLVPAYRKRK